MTLKKAIRRVYEVPEKEAIASQYFVAQITGTHHSMGATAGDSELILSDEDYSVGREYSFSADGVTTKTYKIVGGPFECPPMPHVLALEMWVEETQPREVMEHWSA